MSDPRSIQEIIAAMALVDGVDLSGADGPPVCFVCHEAVVMRTADTCSDCATKKFLDERRAALLDAWNTVPASLRGWCSLTSPKLVQWVPDRDARAAVAKVMQEPWAHRFVTFTGPAGAGKTSLACALLCETMRQGAVPDASRGAIWTAQKARFAAAPKLIEDRAATQLGVRVDSIERARFASVLVLDEVGRGKDTHNVIFDLVYHRHAQALTTIITTPYPDEAALAHVADGGLARRVFADATVIEVRK